MIYKNRRVNGLIELNVAASPRVLKPTEPQISPIWNESLSAIIHIIVNRPIKLVFFLNRNFLMLSHTQLKVLSHPSYAQIPSLLSWVLTASCFFCSVMPLDDHVLRVQLWVVWVCLLGVGGWWTSGPFALSFIRSTGSPLSHSACFSASLLLWAKCIV